MFKKLKLWWLHKKLKKAYKCSKVNTMSGYDYSINRTKASKALSEYYEIKKKIQEQIK